MSPRATVPLTNDVSAALARFFFASAGPSHSTISRVLTGTGYGDDYVYDASGQGPEQGVPRSPGTERGPATPRPRPGTG